MKEWSSLITAAIVGGFGYLTAMATLSTKKVDSSSEMTKTSFDVILKFLRKIKLNFSIKDGIVYFLITMICLD